MDSYPSTTAVDRSPSADRLGKIRNNSRTAGRRSI